MAKQKSVAELNNLVKEYEARLEGLEKGDKEYRNIQSKLKAAKAQLKQIQDEAVGVDGSVL